MKIKSINVIKGENKWSDSKGKLIHMVLDLGEYEQKPSNKIEGFYERIKEYLPSLKSHRCSEGKPGGFLKRIKEGTWMGHIIEHVALELQALAGYDTGWGRTRGVKGQKGIYNVVFNYEDEDKGKIAAREAYNVVNDIINNKNPQIDKIVKKLKSKSLKESIRRILREEINSVDQKTTQIELVKLMGPSNIKKGNRIEIVNKIMSFGSNIDIIVDYLDQETLDKINNFMSQKGWFPHSIGLSDMKQHKYSQSFKNYLGENDVQIGYESNFGKEIKINKTKAFHVTPDIFIDNIKKTGLTLKSESKLSDHPERIYLYLNKDKSNDMVTALWNSLSKEKKQTIKNYYVLEIDLTQIPNHKFYIDSQSLITFEAIYTTQPIPKSAIKVIDKVDTTKLKSYDDEIVMTPEDEKRTREEKKRKEEERLKQEKESAARQAKSDEVNKEFEKLPDDLKNMDIGDLMNIQESIKKILMEDYSPAGKEITPNEIVVHKSNPMFRDKIMSEGLKVKAGECYKIYVGYGTKCKPAIFATNSTNKRVWFDSTYDDDIWFINTTKIPDVKWFKDRHFESRSKHIVTFQDIPSEALTLHYEGTGSGDVEKWDKDSPNLFESIRRILREEGNIPSYLKRRLFIVDKYIDDLDPEDVCRYWRDDESKDYVNESMAEITRSIIDFSINISDDEYSEKFDEVYGILIDLGYREKFKDFFYESLQNCNPKHRMRFMKP